MTGGTHTGSLFALVSAPERILSELFLSAPCQNIWCKLPAAHQQCSPSPRVPGGEEQARIQPPPATAAMGQGEKESMLHV